MIINKTTSLIIPDEFTDVNNVLIKGAEKYPANNWLEPNGLGIDHKTNHDSMFHHLARSFAGERTDTESSLDHLLHLACRALMEYTRIKRGIKHEKD